MCFVDWNPSNSYIKIWKLIKIKQKLKQHQNIKAYNINQKICEYVYTYGFVYMAMSML